MNDIFSIKRFWLLLKKFTKEHIKTYLLYVAGLAGILLVVYGLTLLNFLSDEFPGDMAAFYFFVGIASGSSLFAASFYGFYNNKAKAIQFTNLPASPLEKLTISFLFTQIVFFFSYIAVFLLVDKLMGGLYDHFRTIPKGVGPEQLTRFQSKPINLNAPFMRGLIIFSFVLSSVAHLGSLRFEKNAFIKTALLFIPVAFGHAMYGFYSMRALISEELMPNGIVYNDSIRVGNEEVMKGIVSLPQSWSDFIYWLLPVMVYVLFWTASYFKLKEKQV